jgi:predicted ATP-dependent endonuclease of OLD family
MKLKKLRLRNFRCYKDEISINFDDLTTIIGKNEAGKSAILDALDIFFNGLPDSNDGSKNGDPSDLTIICEFTDLPESIILDDSIPTTLEAEHLLNEEKRLEIHKHYSGNIASPKCKSIEACALHPTTERANDLLRLKNRDLIKRGEEIGIDFTDVSKKENAPIRAKIKEKIGDLRIAKIMVPLNEENNTKDVWSKLNEYIPTYALFKSDRSSTDKDSEAQDPITTAVKEAIKEKESDLDAISKHVSGKVQSIANLTLNKLQEIDPNLATELKPNFTNPKWDSVFKASLTSDENIPINKRGSGVRRLILLSFFRAKVELMNTENTNTIYAVEEPETSQHPNNQRLLVRTLCDLSTQAQIILTTHTPVLARTLPQNSIRYIKQKANGSREIVVSSGDTEREIAKTLGILPDDSIKLFIGVEGPNDIAFLVEMSKILKRDGIDILDLGKMEQDGELIFFPLGGQNLALWTSRLEPLAKPEFHLYDRDCQPPAQAPYQIFADEVNMRLGCKALLTDKKEIENYIHKDAIIAAYAENGCNITIPNNFLAFEDVPMKVAEVVHTNSGSPKRWDQLSEKDKASRASHAKSIICRKATKHMTLALLRQIDPNNEAIGWFTEIKQRANNV